jgi:hypothetical protein
MAWTDIALSGAKSLGSFILSSAEAKNKRKWQKYNNAMLMLQSGQNNNVLTDNENMARERSAEEAFLIRRSEYITKASVEVEAAASGTVGRSVNMVLFDVGRNAAVADRDRQRDLDLQYLGFDNQRRQLAMETKMSLDTSDIPNPNPFSAALGFLGDTAGSWGDFKPMTATARTTSGNTGSHFTEHERDPIVSKLRL